MTKIKSVKIFVNRFVKRYKKGILLSAIIIVALSSSFLYIKNNTKLLGQKSLSQEVDSILDECKLPSENLISFDPACATERFEHLATRENLEEVMNILERKFSEQESGLTYGTTSCHAPGHLIGEVAYEKGISFNELLDICSTKCGFGCLHGGFVAKVSEKGGDFLENLQDSCESLQENPVEDVRSCWHVVGHSLAEYFPDDVSAASKKCLELSGQETRWHCVSGARMEYLIGVTYNPDRDPLEFTVDNFVSFCREFPVEYQDDCFGEAAYYSFRITGDEALSIDICNKIPIERYQTRIKCAFGGGSVFVSVNKDSPDKVYSYCQKFGEQTLVNECIIGAIDIFSSEWDYLKNGAELCRLGIESFQDECLSYYGERLEWWYDADFREKVCGELQEKENISCMSTPTNPRNYLQPPKELSLR